MPKKGKDPKLKPNGLPETPFVPDRVPCLFVPGPPPQEFPKERHMIVALDRSDDVLYPPVERVEYVPAPAEGVEALGMITEIHVKLGARRKSSSTSRW